MTSTRKQRPDWRGYTEISNHRKVKDVTFKEIRDHVKEANYTNHLNIIEDIFTWLREAEQNVEWLEEEVALTAQDHMETHKAFSNKIDDAMEALRELVNYHGPIPDHVARELAIKAIRLLNDEPEPEEQVLEEDSPFHESVF